LEGRRNEKRDNQIGKNNDEEREDCSQGHGYGRIVRRGGWRGYIRPRGRSLERHQLPLLPPYLGTAFRALSKGDELPYVGLDAVWRAAAVSGEDRLSTSVLDTVCQNLS
jgi:hypothetical protein